MRPQQATTSGVSTSSVIPLDHYVTPFNVGMVVAVTGSATYTVQHTMDDVLSPTFSAGSATWLNHPVLVTQTATADGNYAFPVRGVRVNQTSGAGSTVITLVQAGGGR